MDSCSADTSSLSEDLVRSLPLRDPPCDSQQAPNGAATVEGMITEEIGFEFAMRRSRTSGDKGDPLSGVIYVQLNDFD